MKSKVIAAALLIFAIGLAAQTTAQKVVPLTAEPSHHLVLENKYVRVFKVEVPPHSQTKLHQHDHDYVFVTLGDSNVSNEVASKAPVTLQLKDGETRFVKGGFAHVAKNLAARPFRNITVEILPRSSTEICGPNSKPCIGRGMIGGIIASSREGVIETDVVRVQRVAMMPGIGDTHRHDLSHLVIAVSDLNLKNDVEGKGTSEIHQKAGDVAWIPGGFTHTLTNVGKAPARFVTLEFK